jgi:hypothetical protein
MHLRRKRAGLGLWALAAVMGLAVGCAGLCTMHLYVFRDSEARSLPPEQMALLITDPGLAAAISGGTGAFPAGGCQWDQDQSVHPTDTYRLSLDRVDDQPVYQGRCLDTLPTYSLEVRPGRRRVLGRLDVYGSWGQERKREVKDLDLAAGGVYFLQPDCRALREGPLQVQRLPERYTPQVRSRVTDWNRQRDKTRQLAD